VNYTAEKLEFAKKNELNKGKANCVGYAQFCAAVYNFLIKQTDTGWTAKPVVGVVRISKLNLCDFVSSKMPNSEWKNFTKNHDFVEFRIDNSTIYEDPCLLDVIGITCETYEH
jgi:hypothetical protein